jgi:hypothetical protein
VTTQYDPLDQKAQDKQEQQRLLKAKIQDQTEEGDIEWLMKSKRGRRVLLRVINRSGVYASSFHQNSMTMAYNEGARMEGLHTVKIINSVAPDLFMTMLKEANDN